MRLRDREIIMLAGPGYEDLEFWVVYPVRKSSIYKGELKKIK